jgi:ribosomal protein L11 methyltransferase
VIWENQWKLFAPNFRNGKAHIDLTPYGHPATLELYPGPGFGDFSHPTTRLALKLMAHYTQDSYVIDIGCGSGILSLAATAMGAKSVYGYDIDPEAVEHAKKNLSLLQHSQEVIFSDKPPQHIPAKAVLLMNMIHSEQMEAWKVVQDKVGESLFITSGILESDIPSYLEWMKMQSYSLQKSLSEEGWSGFVFSK